MDGGRDLDVVVFGATGFAGRLVAAYLAGHAPAGTRIGLAGRSPVRLAEVRAGLGDVAAAWPLLAGDQATAVMFGESALCLALDAGRLPGRAGVLTPATAMGATLATRLRSAGLTLSVQRSDPERD